MSTLCREEAKILEVRTEYDDGLQNSVKNRLQDLCEKLEEFYNEMDEQGALLTDEVLITEANKNFKSTFTSLTSTLQLFHGVAVAVETQEGYLAEGDARQIRRRMPGRYRTLPSAPPRNRARI